jgi:hypothetical protein
MIFGQIRSPFDSIPHRCHRRPGYLGLHHAIGGYLTGEGTTAAPIGIKDCLIGEVATAARGLHLVVIC